MISLGYMTTVRAADGHVLDIMTSMEWQQKPRHNIEESVGEKATGRKRAALFGGTINSPTIDLSPCQSPQVKTQGGRFDVLCNLSVGMVFGQLLTDAH